MSENNLFICVDGDVLDIDTIYRYLRVFRELKILGDPEYGKIVAEINSKDTDICLLSRVLSNLIFKLKQLTFREKPYSISRLLDIKYPNKNIDNLIVKKFNKSVKYLSVYIPKFKYSRDISDYYKSNEIILSRIHLGVFNNSLLLYLHERNIKKSK